jgi:hypothetical protein
MAEARAREISGTILTIGDSPRFGGNVLRRFLFIEGGRGEVFVSASFCLDERCYDEMLKGGYLVMCEGSEWVRAAAVGRHIERRAGEGDKVAMGAYPYYRALRGFAEGLMRVIELAEEQDRVAGERGRKVVPL